MDNKSMKELLAEKAALLEGIMTLTRKQQELITTESMEDLLSSLEQREDLMVQIDRINAALSIDNRNIDSELIALDNKCKTIIASALKLDAQNRALAQKGMDEMRGKVKTLNHGKTRLSAYVRNSGESALYFNKKK